MTNETGPTPAEMKTQRAQFSEHNKRLASIMDRGYDVRQDAIIASAMIEYLFGATGTKERNAFDVFATRFFGMALNEIETKIEEMQEAQKREYTRQQLLSGVKRSDLRFPKA